MNTITIPTIDNTDMQLQIPERLSEITFGQLVKLKDQEITNLEVLSILSGVPLDNLYSAKSYDETTKMAKLYIDMFNYSAANTDLNKIPQTINVSFTGKRKLMKIEKYICITPAGAYIAADKVISDEIYKHIEIFGEDNWRENFNPSLVACGQVVDAYLFHKVTRKLWIGETRDTFADEMPADQVLMIAKHFFNACAKLKQHQTEG